MLHVPEPLSHWVLDEEFIERAMVWAADRAVVSLDVFDTALTRLLDSPADVFAETERRLVEQLGSAARGFAQIREDSEREARLRYRLTRDAEEVDHAAILAVLIQRMPALAGHAALVCSVEIAVERSVLVAVPDILELTRRLQRIGKPYLFVSDMYLSSEVLAGFLRQAGFDGWAGLHVSSETGATKASGRQWQVIRQSGVDLGSLLHIGDDSHADIEGPKAHGIETLLYTRARSERRTGGVLRPAVVAFSRACREVVLQRRADPARVRPEAAETWQDSGRVLGCIVVGSFLRWLEGRVRLHGIETLYFCARDGWLMQRAWRAAGLDRATGAQDHYLCVSRRTLNLARGYAQSSPGQLQPSLLAFLSSTDGNTTIRAALDRIGLSGNTEILADLHAHHDSLDDPLTWPDGVNALRTVLRNHSATVHERLRQSHAGLTAYLRQEGFGHGGRSAIVDLGWHGSMQRSLRHLVEAEKGPTPLVGFYYGLWQGALGNHYGAGLMEAAFASDFMPAGEQSEMHEAVEILEELHAAPHGTVVSFRETDGIWRPNFADSAPERQQYEAVTRHFQDGTLAAIGEIFGTGRSGSLRLEDLTQDAARAALGALCLSPTSEELSRFGALGHCATFDHARFDRLVVSGGLPENEEAMFAALGRSGWRHGTMLGWYHAADEAERERLRNFVAAHCRHYPPRILRQFG